MQIMARFFLALAQLLVATTRVEDIGDAKTSEAKQIQLYLVLQGKDGILYLVTTLRKNSFR